MKKNIFDFNFAKVGKRYFLSNFMGLNCFLSSSDFYAMVKKKKIGRSAENDLLNNFFFGNYLDFDKVFGIIKERFFTNWKGPHVHIISVTKRCNFFCHYCGANSGLFSPSESDMTIKTAKKAVNFIFSIDNKNLMVEFQGGEPLLNFKGVEYIIKESEKRNRIHKKNLNFSIVTNLSLMDNKKFEFLLKHKVAICGSLDGHRRLHDLNRRPIDNTSSYETVSKWLKKINSFAKKGKTEQPNAICTISRQSLSRSKEIVDEHLRIGLNRIQVGPLDKAGRAKTNWDKVGYSPNEFLKFYNKLFDYIVVLNKKGVPIYEKGAFMFIKQILTAERPRYHNLDLLVRIAYNFDGSIYGSDEARMLSNSGIDLLKLGNLENDSLTDILRKPLAKLLLLADFNFLSQPKCSRCPWSPYCHIMPALNISSQNSFWGNMATNDRCKIYCGIFNMISQRLNKKSERKIFEGWLSLYNG
ncbi:MAG: radical SAM protein [Elusimicrobia bacterium]|nr:radical SAM protein [Elusimicrobiota bacterium]